MGLNSKFLVSSVTRDGGASSMDMHADENGKNENENLTSTPKSPGKQKLLGVI